jgi:hypothetical protein
MGAVFTAGRLARRLGVVARGLGSRLGRWLGRRLLELRLGLGRRLGLGHRSHRRASRGRDRFAAGLWRRSRLLGPATGLDSRRTLSWPTAGEHLRVNVYSAAGSVTSEVKASKAIKREPPL